MPGHFGTADVEDGLFASTKSSGNVGAFGSNESLDAPTGGGAGGAGVFGLTNSPGAAGVFGANNGAKGVGVQGNGPEAGVSGFSQPGTGVRGNTGSSGNFGVFGINDSLDAPTGGGAGGAGVFGLTNSPGAAGVFGANNGAKGVGVQGNGPEAGVSGFSQPGTGVRGNTGSSGNFGVFGINDSLDAPTGGGAGGAGVFGLTNSPGAAGVFGANNGAKGVGVQGNGPEAGVSGFSQPGTGVRGDSTHASGVEGSTNASDQSGIVGINNASGQVPDGLNRPAGNGVWGHTKVEKGSGVFGSVEPGVTNAAGVTGIGPTAGQFFGDVIVTGDIQLTGADYAEDFDLTDAHDVDPGSVMVLDDAGFLQESQRPYDGRVAGVVCGAGGFRPAVILDRRGDVTGPRAPVALMGKVYCKVDATYGPIRVGDLLTTSATPGHAMHATDRALAFGAILGKALACLDGGQALVPVLVTLQ